VRALFLSGQHIIHPPGVTREARYRRAEFGRSSEKLARESEQLRRPENRPPPAVAVRSIKQRSKSDASRGNVSGREELRISSLRQEAKGWG